MSNSIAVGRRLAVRVVIAQASVSLLVAVAFLVNGWHAALAAFSAGLAVAIGNAVLGLRLFTSLPARAGNALARLIAGTALRWLAIVGGLYFVIVVLELPPLPALCGFMVAMITQLIGLRVR